MTRFRLRAWHLNTFVDTCDYVVEAKDLAEATELLDDLQSRAQEAGSLVSLPRCVLCVASEGRQMRALTPEKLVTDARGIVEILTEDTEHQDPPVSAAVQWHDVTAAILREFIRDVEAAGVETIRREWPDLAITYEKAKAAMLPTQQKR
jgi:hypothetical protein